MELDVTKLVGAVKREVRDTERDGRPARMVVATRVYDTDIEDAWDAVTSAERIPRWFLPIEGELELGGRYQLKGHAGGTIETCERPRSFSVTWESGGQTSWVAVRLEPAGAEKTRLTVEHTAHIDPRWGEYGPGAVGLGWDLMLLGIHMHLVTKAAVTTEGQAWAASDEGKRFQRLCGDDWCTADIAAGADSTQARAAADRTIAAYLG